MNDECYHIASLGFCPFKPADASHLSQSDTDTTDPKPLELDQTESFCDWLDRQGDSLEAPTSFSEWLREREDSI